MLTPLLAMVRKDLQLFFADRRSVIMAFAVPIAIASFFGSIFSGSANGDAARIPIRIVDQDASAVSRAIITGLEGDKNLKSQTVPLDQARDDVRRGKATVGVVIPNGFGDAAGRAFFRDSNRPSLDFLYDPSHSAELGMVRGILTERVMQAVSTELFTGESGRKIIDETLGEIDSFGMSAAEKSTLRDLLSAARRANAQNQTGGSGPRGFTMPYSVREEAVTSRPGTGYNGYAHSFAGMGIQFLLFATANLGIEILLERQRGLWKRLRSAPISRFALLAGKTLSMTAVSLMTLWVSFAFAIVAFGVKVQGSVPGFIAVSVACSLMAATYGLVIAAIGRTPAATRGVTIFVTLIMVMLGGAWVPTFVFPAWLQRLTVVVPVRWAVDGLDAMTWRGLGLGSAMMPTLMLLAFALLFATVATARFRWEEA